MRKLFLSVLLIVSLSACNDETSRIPRVKAIRKVFPTSKIFYMPSGSGTIFYVIDSTGQLYEVITGVDPVNFQLSSVQRGIECP